jgi:hypothetical protein
MVDAQPAVAPEAEVAVVPPAVALGRLREQAVRVGQAQRDQGAQVVTLLLGAVDGVLQTDRVPHVVVVERDVVVAHQHQAGMVLQFGAHPVAQGLEPVHLVVELVAARCLAVREIGADHPHAVDRGGQHAGHVVVKAGDVAHHVGGGEREMSATPL